MNLPKYYFWYEVINGVWKCSESVYHTIEQCKNDNFNFITILEEKGLCYKFYEAKPYKGE